MQFLITLLVAIIFATIFNAYAYKRFIKKVDIFLPFLGYFKIFFIFIATLEFLFFINLRLNFLNSFFYAINGFFIAFSWLLFCITILYDIFNLIFNRINFNQNRRKFLKICFDVSFVVIFFSSILSGFFSAVKPPKFTHKKVKIKNLKKPLRIAMVSDVHIGEILKKDFLSSLVDSINLTNPDIVAIVGDLVDLDATNLGDFLEPLKNLKSRYGTFYVPGNHEYYHGIEGILEKIKENDVRILGNECEILDDINLCGVYDLAGFRFKKFEPDLEKTLKCSNPNKPVVLLSHQPKFVKFMDKNVDLMLCGHTHGGQIFPFHFLVLLDQPYLYGLYQHNDKMQILVSSGAGFWGAGVRFLAPSEIVVIDLEGEKNENR